MSALNQSKDLESNENIIEEITKDLDEHLGVSESNLHNGTSETNVFSENQDDKTDQIEDSDVEENNDTLADDYIDEVALKDLEVTLSDSEKEDRLKKALDLKNIGNQKFKEEKYLESINSYTEGLRICPLKFEPERSVLYANRAACKAKLNRKSSAIEDCTKAIELNINYVKAYLRRAKLYEETDKLDESLEDYKKILELDPKCQEALVAQVRLPPMINDRNEKLKTEMLGKLKDLGNVILRPFGLSTDNFQLNQDPNSGGYSISFNQTPR